MGLLFPLSSFEINHAKLDFGSRTLFFFCFHHGTFTHKKSVCIFSRCSSFLLSFVRCFLVNVSWAFVCPGCHKKDALTSAMSANVHSSVSSFETNLFLCGISNAPPHRLDEVKCFWHSSPFHCPIFLPALTSKLVGAEIRCFVILFYVFSCSDRWQSWLVGCVNEMFLLNLSL